jgi:hypothetical protein
MSLRVRLESLFMRLSPSRLVDGLWLGVNGDQDDEHILSRVEEALNLIKVYDTVRYRRLLRDLERIWVYVLTGPRGSFNFTFRRCDLDYRFVAEASAEAIASIIVHEATHAHRCLIKFGYPEERRFRIEQICMRQQLAFADRLPNGGAIRKEIEWNLTRPSSDWSSDALRNLHLAGELVAARQVGIPDWLVRILLSARDLIWRLQGKAPP